MKHSNIGAVIVTDHGSLVGVFTERDGIQRVIAENVDPTSTALSQVMSWGIITVTMDTPVSRVIHIMHENNFRHVPVVDRLGAPLGMVSIRDILGDEVLGLFDHQDHPSTEIVD
jgi:CBS domain-containing protein